MKVFNYQKGFGSVTCNFGVLAEGRWYYEVTLLTDGLCQIGWATEAAQYYVCTDLALSLRSRNDAHGCPGR